MHPGTDLHSGIPWKHQGCPWQLATTIIMIYLPSTDVDQQLLGFSVPFSPDKCQ